MANCNDVWISGYAPFDLGLWNPKLSTEEKQMLQSFFANRMTPADGFEFKFDYGGQFYRESEHGGQCSMYPFIWDGCEAMWAFHILTIVKIMIKSGWEISEAMGVDVDNNDSKWKLNIKQLKKQLKLDDNCIV